MANLSKQEINDFKKIILSNLSDKDLKEITDKFEKSDNKMRKRIRWAELILFYVGMGVIIYKLGWIVGIAFWFTQISQIIGIIRAVTKKNSLVRLFEKQGKPVTIETIIADLDNEN